MIKKANVSVLVAVLAVASGMATWIASTHAQDAASAATSARVGDDEAGRLPPGYTVVVTRSQRAKIYSIQDKYQKQLDELKAQIAKIEDTRDKEVESLLDDKQKEIIGYVLKLRERERNESSGSAGGN